MTWMLFFVVLIAVVLLMQWQLRRSQRYVDELKRDLSQRLDRTRLRRYLGVDDQDDSSEGRWTADEWEGEIDE